MDELDTIESVGGKTLKLIVTAEKETIQQGKALIQQVRQEFTDVKLKQSILELIETILIYKLPQITRQEIEKMFTLNDLSETKVYQEALEEGMEKAKIDAIPRLQALGLGSEQIAQALDLSLEIVNEVILTNND